MTDAMTALSQFVAAHPTPLAFSDATHDKAHGDWAGAGTGTTWCALFVYRFGQMFVPGWAPSVTGPTAWDVVSHSGIVDTNWATAPTNAIHHFREKGGTRPGHVAVQVEGPGGRAAMSTSATVGTTVVKGIILCTIPQYLAQKGGIVEYVGWGMDYAGARFNFTDPTVLLPKQRRANSLGANARAQATTQVPIVADKGVKAGTVGNFDGWIHGEKQADGNDVWFHGAISGNWYWSGGFTDPSTHDLVDMNAAPVTDPKARMVLTTASANARKTPDTQTASIGSVAAGTVVEMTDFTHGQDVSNANAHTDVWYSDGKAWYWAGGFTSIDTTGLNDRSAEFAPPAPIVMASFGIDINGDKDGIDIAKAKADGVEFVIVKMGGHNTSKQYVGDKYKGQVDRVLDAGMHLGHYYVTGAGTIADEAKFFVDGLHHFEVEEDVLMLDNELFGHGPNGDQNVNSQLWDDDQTAEFFTTVHELTGIPYSRLWHYFNDVDYVNGPGYPKTEALGVRKVPANYFANPTARVVQNEPRTPDFWATQWSSQQTVGGFGPVDGYWSHHTVKELFARGDVVSPAPVDDPPADATTPPTDDGGTTTEPPVTTPPVTTPPKSSGKGGFIAGLVTLVITIAGMIAAIWPWK